MSRRRRDWKRRLLSESDQCHYCRRSITDPDQATIDHVIPLARGGADAWHNVVLACRDCNQLKADNDWGSPPHTRGPCRFSDAELEQDIDW